MHRSANGDHHGFFKWREIDYYRHLDPKSGTQHVNMVATFTHIHSHIVIFWYIFLSFIKIYLIGAGCLIAQCVQRMKKTKGKFKSCY